MNKSAGALKLSLAKAGIVTPPQVDLAFVLDVSGSFDDEHRSGITNDLLKRLTPWGMVFDPNQQLDVLTFSNGAARTHHVGTVTPATVDGYVQKHIIDRVPGYNGGTDYSYVIEKTLELFGWKPAPAATPAPQKRSWWGGAKPAATTATKPVEKKRSIVLFITDGDNGDKDRTRQILRESEQRGDGVYFLFIGVSNQGSTFPFLESIGDEFGNTGLVTINDLQAFVNQDDDAMNQALLGDELLTWLKK